MANSSTDLTTMDTNDLAVTDMDSDNQEQKSGFLGSLSGVDVMRQVTLIIALTICVAIAVFFMIWAKEPDMRPLGKMPMDELIQTLEFLDAQKVEYKLDGNDMSWSPTHQSQFIKLEILKYTCCWKFNLCVKQL